MEVTFAAESVPWKEDAGAAFERLLSCGGQGWDGMGDTLQCKLLWLEGWMVWPRGILLLSRSALSYITSVR